MGSRFASVKAKSERRRSETKKKRIILFIVFKRGEMTDGCWLGLIIYSYIFVTPLRVSTHFYVNVVVALVMHYGFMIIFIHLSTKQCIHVAFGQEERRARGGLLPSMKKKRKEEQKGGR